MFSKIPTANKENKSDEPPKLTKIRGTPVSGNIDTIAPILIKICTKNQVEIPTATNLEKSSGAFFAILYPLIIKTRNNPRIRRDLKNPNSSAIIGKMASVVTSGR